MGFYDPLIAIIAGGVAIALFIPKVQNIILKKFESLAGSFAKRPAWASFGIVALILITGAYLVPAKLHLLGDGALLIRVINGLGEAGETPPAFNHQPLVGLIFTGIKTVSESVEALPAETLFRAIDSVAALLFTFIVFRWSRVLQLKPPEKFLLGSFLFFAGGSQFFFGYVELYVFLYTATAAYILTGWMALEKRISIIIPFLCFGIMTALHFSALILAPSLIILMYDVWSKRKSKALAWGFSVVGLAALLLVIMKLGPAALEQRITMEVRYNFLPLFSNEGYFPYTLFSVKHYIDWFNANTLIAPFALLVSVILIIRYRKEIFWKSPLFVFLGTAALFGLVFTFTVNTALGMARDWDFLASFFIPVIILTIYLLQQQLQKIELRGVIVTIVLLAGLHTCFWIGINGNENRHLTRYKELYQSAYLSPVSKLNYHETLGAFFYSRNEMQNASIYFNHYLEIDSSNVRILANISQVERKLGNEEMEFRWLKRAVALQSPNPIVYMNLGVLYAHRRDTLTAIALNEQALRIDSTIAKAHANLAILQMLQDHYLPAAEHYSKAIAYGLTEHFLFRDAASAYFFLGRYDESLKYYNAYLALEPGDMRAKSIRDQLQGWITSGKQ